MMEYLAVVVLGKNDGMMINELTQHADSCECNIIETRMGNIGSEFVANILFAGKWSALAKLETHLSALQKKLDLKLLIQRTKLSSFPADQTPYSVYVSAIDEHGIAHKIINFFAEQAIPIHEFWSENYNLRRTNKPLLTLTMTISLPADMLMGDLRDRFLVFCDTHNFDGSLELEKN